MNSGLIATAALLGVTHAIEPDHLAGIVGLAGDANRTRGALVGACFGAGHATLVVGWLGVATLMFDGLPPFVATAGDTALGAALLVTAGVVVADAYRSTRSGGHGHAHGRPLLARADGGTSRLLAVGIVGALFTLSPPLTMLGFVTGVLPTVGSAGAWATVGGYTVAIVLTMASVGAAGSTAVQWLGTRRERYAVAVKLAAAFILATLGVSVLV